MTNDSRDQASSFYFLSSEARRQDADEEIRFVADEFLGGLRLDEALSRALPGVGGRGAKRLADSGRILVNGRAARASARLKAGQVIQVLAEKSVKTAAQVRIVAESADFLALAKPAGLHSEALAGGGGPSVEAALGEAAPGAILVNRLDFPVSGLVLAARNDVAARMYRDWEDGLRVTKQYLAVVHGLVAAPLAVDRALDAAKRRKTRVLDRPAGDPVRITRATPLAAGEMDGQPVTLLSVQIHKGARHQIRAHLAWAGHPILGDSLYGEATGPQPEMISLHHARIELPGFTASLAPDWPNLPSSFVAALSASF